MRRFMFTCAGTPLALPYQEFTKGMNPLTKQAGTDEKVRVQFQASFGIQSLERKVDVLSPEEWIEFRTAYNNNRYISQYGSKGATIEDDYATRLAMIGGKESYYFLNDPRWTEPGYGNQPF